MGHHGARKSGCTGRQLEQIRQLGGGRPREMGARWLHLHSRRFARRRPLAGLSAAQQRARNARHHPVRRMGGGAALVQQPGGHERHFVLRQQPVARGGGATAAPGGDLRLGGLDRRLSRRQPARRHRLHLSQELAGHAGQDRAAWRGVTRPQKPGHRRTGLRARDTERRGVVGQPRGHVGRGVEAQPRFTLLPRTLGRPLEGGGAPALSRQLGRPGAAPARQFRGLHRLRVDAKMAGGTRRIALGAFLHRLWGEAAKALFRPFPQGRRQRLGA